ncbi:MAG: hypothetical protein COA79_12950 [Planctomycetota bacterium]|nr:MAG: hypothetical protein COA79_12950 [Planctomycetota bacterium]
MAMTFTDCILFDFNDIQQRLLPVIETFNEENAFIRPSKNMNHAAWLLGHILWVEDYLAAEVPDGKVNRRIEWDVHFGDGSPCEEKNKLPLFSDIVDHYHEVHGAVLTHIKSFEGKDLNVAPKKDQFFKSKTMSLIHLIEEISYHFGQMQYLSKILNS